MPLTERWEEIMEERDGWQEEHSLDSLDDDVDEDSLVDLDDVFEVGHWPTDNQERRAASLPAVDDDYGWISPPRMADIQEDSGWMSPRRMA